MALTKPYYCARCEVEMEWVTIEELEDEGSPRSSKCKEDDAHKHIRCPECLFTACVRRVLH